MPIFLLNPLTNQLIIKILVTSRRLIFVQVFILNQGAMMIFAGMDFGRGPS